MTETHATRWWSPRLERDMPLVRWGHYGQPVLLLPTAGGDPWEAERMGTLGALSPLIEAGRIKLYSLDSVSGRAWATKEHTVDYRRRLQSRFHSYVEEEVVPAIRADCRDDGAEVVLAGASIGAFNAVALLCRRPDLFRAALGMSGTYDLEKLLEFRADEAFYLSSPLLFLPGLGEGRQLDLLRRRFVLLACGEGRWESPEESWRMARALGAKGVPNRVDVWGGEWDHDWPTWREMLPRYLGEVC